MSDPEGASGAQGFGPVLRGVHATGFLIELPAAIEPATDDLEVGLASDGRGPAFCPEVRGFDELLRLEERGDAAPVRLMLAGLDAGGTPWLGAWSEDEHAVRRTLRVTRLADGRALTVVATLAVFGRGVETALAVSVLAPGRTHAARARLDSGVCLSAR